MLTEALKLAYGGSTHGREPSSGIIHIGIKTNGFMKTIKSCKISNLQEFSKTLKLHKTSDYYITANPTKRGIRQATEAFSLNNIVIDIDCHSSKIDNYDRLKLLEDYNYRIQRDLDDRLKPNMSVFTGRGLQLWYCFEETATALIFLYKRVVMSLTAYLKSLFEEYPYFEKYLHIDSAPSSNIVGYFRYFEGFNTKTGLSIETQINHTQRFNFNSVLELLQELGITADSKITTQKQKIIALNDSFKNLNYKRLDFIEWLIARRNAPVGSEYRDLMLFAYYNSAIQIFSRDKAKQRLLRLNQGFKEPIDIKKINSICDYINSKGFLRFSQDNWYKFITATDDERSSYEYMRRNKSNYTRDTECKKRKEERNAQIIQLKNMGLTNRAIAEQMQLSADTVGTVIKNSGINEREVKKQRLMQMRNAGVKVKDICSGLNISLSTYKRLLKEIKNEQIN